MGIALPLAIQPSWDTPPRRLRRSPSSTSLAVEDSSLDGYRKLDGARDFERPIEIG